MTTQELTLRDRIERELADCPEGLSTRALAKRTGSLGGQVRRALRAMREDGSVVTEDGSVEQTAARIHKLAGTAK